MNNNILNSSSIKRIGDNYFIIVKKIERKLALIYGISLSIIPKILLFSILATLLTFNHKNPETNLIILASIILIFINSTIFSVWLWLIDLNQQWFYQIRWISWSELTDLSPEAAEVIKQICLTKNIQKLRLGIINNASPTALIYGYLPNSGRLLISKGLFANLNEKGASNLNLLQIGQIVD